MFFVTMDTIGCQGGAGQGDALTAYVLVALQTVVDHLDEGVSYKCILDHRALSLFRKQTQSKEDYVFTLGRNIVYIRPRGKTKLFVEIYPTTSVVTNCFKYRIKIVC